MDAGAVDDPGPFLGEGGKLAWMASVACEGVITKGVEGGGASCGRPLSRLKSAGRPASSGLFHNADIGEVALDFADGD